MAGIPWNKGLTKDTDKRVTSYSAKRIGMVFSKEHRENIGRVQRGVSKGTYDISRRAKIAEGRRRHIANNVIGCRCGPCGGSNSRNTNIERILRDQVLVEFPEVRANVRFGRYEVDAYLPPPYHLAFEADGTYWHNRPGDREANERRDAELLLEFNLPVVRLTEEELKKW